MILTSLYFQRIKADQSRKYIHVEENEAEITLQ